MCVFRGTTKMDEASPVLPSFLSSCRTLSQRVVVRRAGDTMLDSPQDLPGVPMEAGAVPDSEGTNGVEGVAGQEQAGAESFRGPGIGGNHSVVEMDVSPTGGHVMLGQERKSVDLVEDKSGAAALAAGDQEPSSRRVSALSSAFSALSGQGGETFGPGVPSAANSATVYRNGHDRISNADAHGAHGHAVLPERKAGPGVAEENSSWRTTPSQDNSFADGRRQEAILAQAAVTASIDGMQQTLSGGLDTQEPRPWWRDRRKLDNSLFRVRLLVALLASGGFFLAAFVTQELPAQDYDPRGTGVQNAKRVEIIIVFFLILALYYMYYLMCIWDVLTEHLKGRPWPEQDRSLTAPFCRRTFWIELFVCIWHNPPNLSFEWGYYNKDFFVAYRSECILSVITSFKLYTLWRVLRDFYLRDLPNRHTISTMVQVHIGSGFAFKRMLRGSSALYTLPLLSSFVILLGSYWVRSAEVSSCRFRSSMLPECRTDAGIYFVKNGVYDKDDPSTLQRNNMLFRDYMWGMSITFMTVGFGDFVALTYVGRIVSVIVALMGIITSATLTSSLAKAVAWTPLEHTTLLLLERDKVERSLRLMATVRIQRWFRQTTGKKPHSSMIRSMVAYLSTSSEAAAFQAAKKYISQNAEDMYGVEGHVDLMLSRSAHISLSVEDTLQKMETRRRLGKVLRWAHSGRARSQLKLPHVELSDLEDEDEDVEGEGEASTAAGDSVSSTPATRLGGSTSKGAPLLHASLHSTLPTLSSSCHTPEESPKAGGGASLRQPLDGDLMASMEGDTMEIKRMKREARARARKEEAEKKLKIRRANSIKKLGKDGMEKIKRTESKAHLPRARDLAQASLIRTRIAALVTSSISVSISIAINVRSWHVHPDTLKCSSGFTGVDVLKLFDLLACITTAMLICRTYQIIARQQSLTNHVTANTKHITSVVADFYTIAAHWTFWVELLISFICLPPCCSFWVGGSRGNVYYFNTSAVPHNYQINHAENIFNCMAVLKIYIMWPVLKEMCYWDLPKRHFVARMTKVKLGSTFALKRLLNSHYAVLFVSLAWIFLLVIFGLLYRNLELTGCDFPGWEGVDPVCYTDIAQKWVSDTTHEVNEYKKINDYTIFSAVWTVFITSATVGYGDQIPTTSQGRVVLFFAGLLGIITAGLLTATIIVELSWTSTEQSVLLILEREKARKTLRHMAAKMIGSFWLARLRMRQARSILQHRRVSSFTAVQNDTRYKVEVKEDFKKVLAMSRVDTERMGGVERKVSTISKRLRDTRETADALADLVGVATTNRRRSMELGLNSQASTMTSPAYRPASVSAA